MPYSVNKTDGSLLATVSDNNSDTSHSVTLIGRNVTNYGEVIAENFIHLLENSAHTIPPANKLQGQLWFDQTDGSLKVWDGTVFKNLSASRSTATEPTLSNVLGDIWFDTVNEQLFIYNGTDFILIGPEFTSAEGTSGAIVETVQDTIAADHVIITHYVSGIVVAITSKDASFTLQTPLIQGFSVISPGIQLASTLAGGTPEFIGTASNATLFDNSNISTFLRTAGSNLSTGTLQIQNDGGLSVGIDDDLELSVTGINATIENKNNDGDIYLKVRNAGGFANIITLDGTTLRAKVDAPLTSSDIANKAVTDDILDGSTSFSTITVTGLVDGRDISTDGIVLDALASQNKLDAGVSLQYGYFGRVYFDTAKYLDTSVGNYGTVEVNGTGNGGWQGYSIAGNAVFMNNGIGQTGIYNDTDDEWLLHANHVGSVTLYYAGADKIATTNTGIDVTGEIVADGDITSGVTATDSDVYVKRTGVSTPLITLGEIPTGAVSWNTAQNTTWVVPAGVTTVFLSGCGAGQGGQGGGDGGNTAPGANAAQGGFSRVIGDYQGFAWLGGWSLQQWSSATSGLVIISYLFKGVATSLLQDVNGIAEIGTPGAAGNAKGGDGGKSMFGLGGFGSFVSGVNTNGGNGGIGAGGAGGAGQDNLAGAGGASGTSAINVPFKVTPGETLSILVGAGSIGTQDASGASDFWGDGGDGGDGFIEIRW